MSEIVPSTQRVAIFIDYENMNRRARSLFGGSTPQDLSPRRLADIVIARRNRTSQPARTVVFRGRPAEGQAGHDRFCAQDAEWQRDPLIEARYADLDYSRGLAREKGVDVALALAVAEMVASGEVDVVVIASEDNDLGPAVEHAKTAGVRVETVVWDDLRGAAKGAVRRAGELHVHAHRLGVDEYRTCAGANDVSVSAKRFIFPDPLPLDYVKVKDALRQEMMSFEASLLAVAAAQGETEALAACTNLLDAYVGPNRAPGAGRRVWWEVNTLLEQDDPDEWILESTGARDAVLAVWRAALGMSLNDFGSGTEVA